MNTMPNTPRPETEAALSHFLDTFANGSLSSDIATSLTCHEAEALADLYRAAGRDDDAADWISDHAEGDDEGDQHHNPCEGHESTDGPIGNVVYCDGTCRTGE